MSDVLASPKPQVASTDARVVLFGIAFDNVTMPEALERLTGLVSGGGKHVVTTANVDHVVRLQRDEAFREAYRNASLAVADGMPVVWASRLFGRPLKARVAGSDLMVQVCALAAARGWSVYFLGGKPGVAERAAENLKHRFGGLVVAGCDAPPLGFESDVVENHRAIERVKAARPDILFLALGAPKQEKWVTRHLDALPVKVAVCVGAGVDFAAGILRRAPRWMQRAGLEWVWRLAQEPGRLWRRYLVEDAAFLGILWHEWRRSRVRTPGRLEGERVGR